VKKGIRFGLFAAGLFVSLAAAVGVAFMIAEDAQVAGSVVARPVGWVAPLVAVFVIVGAAWILLGQGRPHDDDQHGFEHTPCPACEREVLGQWRMCPYCGAMLKGPRVVAAASTSTIDQ
jgi:uncharacterized membrane protein